METLYHYQRSRVFGPGGDPLAVHKVDAQDVFPPHEHDFFEIVLVLGGDGLQKTARQQVPIRQGTLVILRPGHWHAYLRCRRLTIYNCCFGPELLRRELSWLIDDARLARLLWGVGEERSETEPFVTEIGREATRRLERLLHEISGAGAATYGVKVSLLSLFLTSLAQELPGTGQEAEEKVHPLVVKSIRLLESDLSRPWTVQQLAREGGCSPEYLIRLFKGAIGMTPYAYLSRCRAERAASLLLRSQASVAEIGERVGWGEPCHFARRFRHYYGASATAYRVQIKS